MKTYKHKENGSVVTAKVREGKVVISHPDGNETKVTEHKFKKRYELLSKANNS